MRSKKVAAGLAAATLLLVPATVGCSANTISTVSAIGAAGTSSDAYQISARIPSAAGLVRNAPVMMNDATIGSIGDIVIDDWAAKVTMRIEPGVKIPVGSHAMIGMTSVLGSSHIAIVAPEKTTGRNVAPGGRCRCPTVPNSSRSRRRTGRRS